MAGKRFTIAGVECYLVEPRDRATFRDQALILIPDATGISNPEIRLLAGAYLNRCRKVHALHAAMTIRFVASCMLPRKVLSAWPTTSTSAGVCSQRPSLTTLSRPEQPGLTACMCCCRPVRYRGQLPGGPPRHHRQGRRAPSLRKLPPARPLSTLALPVVRKTAREPLLCARYCLMEPARCLQDWVSCQLAPLHGFRPTSASLR